MQLFSMSGLDTYQQLVKAEIHNEAFRLSEDEFNAEENSVVDLQSTIGSISSKERIDLMFRSAHYQQFDCENNERVGNDQRARPLEGKRSAELYYDEEYELPGDEAKNDVQLRIEKMFSEVNGSEEYSMPGKRQFSVKYMGSVPVSGKINSLEGLQTPVSELYFKYRKNEAPDEQSIFDNIEVTLNGLQVEHVSKAANKPILKMYPFSCIAVWVSVKLFCRKRIGGNQQWEYAFLPLVADTENDAENKTGSNGCSLFQRLDTARRTKHFRNRNFDDNSPLFVVVLRETDFQCKQLACQGFVCKSSDEAIALADTLYKVLNSKLRRSQILRTRNQRRRLRYKNGMSRLSSIGETATESLENLQDDDFEHEQQRLVVAHRSPPVVHRSAADALDETAEKLSTTSKPPKRPPRRRKVVDKHRYIDEADDPTTPLLNQPDDNRKKKVHRSRSNVSSEMVGDVLTKIVIPRSRSFLNSDRLSSRYKKRQQQQASVVTEQSPLDFTELFRELRMQEGLTSLEQVLNVIVNADGMSFTDLKPIYKEFLLKLALVLSKDELYDRSKLIMKKQRRKREKRRRIGKFASTKKRLKNIFQPVRKLRSRTASKFSAKNRYNNNNNNNNPGDSTSTDSFFLSKTPLQYTPVAPPIKYRNTNYKSRQLNPRHRCHNKDKDSSLDGAVRGSSSGYFSFSECSYDTESCMCATVDRCYCSMVRKKIDESSAMAEQVQRTTAFESKKKLGELSLVEQLKMKGFAASESSGSSEIGAPSFYAHRDISKQRGVTTKKNNDNFKCPKRMDVYKSSSHVPLQRSDFCRCCSDERNREYSTSLSTGSSKNSTDNLTTVDYNLFAPSTASTKNLCRHRHHWEEDSRHCCRASRTVYAELSHPALSPTFQPRFHRPCERAAAGNFHKLKVIYEREPAYNERSPNDDETGYYSACKCSNCNNRNGYSNYHNDRLHRKIDNDDGIMLPDEYYRKKNKNSKRNYRHHRYKKSDNYFGY